MSAQPVQEPPAYPLVVTAEDIDAVLYEAKGDAREAIRMLLRDLAVMAMDGDGAMSRGFLRGRFSDGARRPQWIEEP